MPEGTELIQIARDGMVLVVAQNNLPKPFTYLRWRIMLAADQFCFYGSQNGQQANGGETAGS